MFGDGPYCETCQAILDYAEGRTPYPPTAIHQVPSGLPDYGDVIGHRYRIVGEVGHGSMSVVFRAEDLEGGAGFPAEDVALAPGDRSHHY